MTPTTPSTKADVTIRPARRTDGPQILDMVRALAAHHGDIATLSPQSLERDLFGPGACAQALLADREGTAIGYAALACYPALHFGDRVMELHHLYVTRAQRGRGVARHLVAAAVDEARRAGCTRLMVGTHPDNARARGVYSTMGFVPHTPRGERFRLDLPPTGALPDGWV